MGTKNYRLKFRRDGIKRKYGEQIMSDLLNRITVNPEVCGGRPCIRGLRVRVKDILDMLAGGATRAEILEDYPYLENDDITAALEFASRAADHPVLVAVEQ
jgi:uncharacterized protein (DUF433 family)